MKPLFISFLFLLSIQLWSNCPPGNITITNLNELNYFISTYPYCTDLPAGLVIGPSTDIQNLNGLTLTSIGSGLVIKNNSMLTDIFQLESLVSITGGIDISSNPSLTSFDLSNVSTQDATNYNVYDNELLTSGLLPTGVTSLSGFLQYRLNPQLDNISEMDQLVSIGQQFNIMDTKVEPLPVFSSLQSIGYGIVVQNNSNITQLPQFPNLNLIVGGIHIETNPSLTGFDLSAVNTQDASSYHVYNNGLLTSALLPTNVTSLSGFLQYRANELLDNISEMNQLVSIGAQLNIMDTKVEPLPTFSSLQSIGNGIVIQDNPNITQLPQFPNLNLILGGIQIHSNPELTDFDLSSVASQDASYYTVYDNQSLTSALLPTGVTSLSGYLQYRLNPLLENVSEMNQLVSIAQQLYFYNTKVNTLPDFASLKSIGNGLDIVENENITQLPLFPSLNIIIGSIYIRANGELTNFDLSNVTSQGASNFDVYNNQKLTSALLPAGIISTSGYIQYHSNPLLNSISEMDQLVSIGTHLTIWETSICILPDFPSLNTIGTNLSIVANTNLQNLPAFHPVLTIAQSLQISYNPLLKDCATPPVCQHLATGGTHSIIDNAGDCYDESAVTNHCINGSTTLPISFPINQIVDHGETIIFSIDNLPLNYQAIWYDEDMTTLLYQDVANYFEYTVDQSTTLFGSFVPIGTPCIGDLVPIEIEVNCTVEIEICDGIDNNSNGLIDEGFDLDNDGVTSCAGDCDENDPNNFPGNVEICDGKDNNCDGQIDEGFDLDCDGIPDCLDNCPEVCNADQLDSDCDGVGDACDLWPGCDDTIDSDGDGIPNCVDLDEISNWACGNGTKVNICHFPQGDPNERFTKCVNTNNVQNHLNNHGDYIGECEQIFCCEHGEIPHTSNDNDEPLMEESFEAYPNPSKGPLTLELTKYQDHKITISISDFSGRKIWSSQNHLVKEPILFLDVSEWILESGIYIISVDSVNGRQSKQIAFVW